MIPDPGATGEPARVTGEIPRDFTSSLGCLVRPAVAGLAAQLNHIPGLGAAERAVIVDAVAAGLYEVAHRIACRVLLIELNAARVEGRLHAGDPAARWCEFLVMSGSRKFWDSLGEHYPALLPRLEAVLARRCAAARQLAARLAADRGNLAALLGGPPGDLIELRTGAGDTHRGGHAVAVLRLGAGKVLYKPRSVLVDQVLGELLRALPGDVPAAIRVPRVVPRGDYGWAEFIAHRYCADDGELARFYAGIGRWLAVTHLLGGSDLHAENVIACGPVPVVIDCETLFAPEPPAQPSGLGLAVDRASRMAGSTVLRTGLLPTRGVALAWRGVDSSAAGSLPGQQPAPQVPVIVDAGTDNARLGYGPGQAPAPACHPSPVPALAGYWGRVLEGFSELSASLRAMDRAGKLEPLVRRFTDCPVRVVPRSTEVYEEIARMLWHPASLHAPEDAADRAAGLLSRMASVMPGAPGDPAVIAAEIADLHHADIPFFATTPRRGSLVGPGGTRWMTEQDLLAATLARWRAADLDLDCQVIRASLVSAYLNEDQAASERRLAPARPRQRRGPGLDARRRELAATLIRQLSHAAMRGSDGTVTWIGPVLNLTGWAVEPLIPDTYTGLAGLAVLFAAYQRETAAGRADAVEQAAALLTATVRTMRAAEDYVRERRSQIRARPPTVGGYVGLGSQIWAWLTLYEWGAAPDGLARARELAALIPAAAAVSQSHDVLTGLAGAIVPLLQLSSAAGERRWRDEAAVIGGRLVQAAEREDGTVCWPSARWPHGVGGFAHGVTGVGWALARLDLAAGQPGAASQPGAATTARAAFAFEEGLYDAEAGGWLDLRDPSRHATVATWCHGAVGIGLAALDLTSQGWAVPPGVLDRAIAATEREGFGWNHTLCHGDLGSWELLDAALAVGDASAGPARQRLAARVISSVEANGPVTGMSRDAFTPGLLPGLSGIAYQLLRLHPASDLPSVLIQAAP